MQGGALYNRLVLPFEDPALEAQPRHEVAVGVGRNLSPGQDTIGPGARFIGVHRLLLLPWVRQQSYRMSSSTVLYGVAVLFYAIPLQWGIEARCCLDSPFPS